MTSVPPNDIDAIVFSNIFESFPDYYLKNFHQTRQDQKKSICSTHSASTLTENFKKQTGLDVSLSNEEDTIINSKTTAKDATDKIYQAMKFAMETTPNTTNNRFFNQLYGGVDTYAILGDMVTLMINPTVHTFEMSPMHHVFEEEIIRYCGEIIGGDYAVREKVAGIMTPGGSIGNLYGMLLGRHSASPDFKRKGNAALGKPLVCLCSKEAHYSVKKNTVTTGVGLDNLLQVPVDPLTHKLNVSDLEKTIEDSISRGEKPFFLQATSGTTVSGAFDDILEIAKVCKKYDIWLHVDASWGGTALLLPAEKREPFFRGIELADSIQWNFHKGLAMGQQCALFLHRHGPSLLEEANGLEINYLFQKKMNSQDDIGNRSIQCGRRGDSMKFWVAWKARGLSYYRSRAEKLLNIAQYAAQIFNESDEFRLFVPQLFVHVCFTYIPQKYRQLSDAEILGNDEIMNEISAFQTSLRIELQKLGAALMTVTFLPGTPKFFRWVFVNTDIEKKDVEYVIKLVAEVAAKMQETA